MVVTEGGGKMEHGRQSTYMKIGKKKKKGEKTRKI